MALISAPGAVTKTAGSSSGSLSLDFTAGPTTFDYLAEHETITLAYTLEVDDHIGPPTPQTFMVTITNDFHVI
jgi:hypothetical protein